MLVSTISRMQSKEKQENDSDQTGLKDKIQETNFEPSNWSYNIMAEDTYTNKIYETLTF